jgi:hypothetical protein
MDPDDRLEDHLRAQPNKAPITAATAMARRQRACSWPTHGEEVEPRPFTSARGAVVVVEGQEEEAAAAAGAMGAAAADSRRSFPPRTAEARAQQGTGT